MADWLSGDSAQRKRGKALVLVRAHVVFIWCLDVKRARIVGVCRWLFIALRTEQSWIIFVPSPEVTSRNNAEHLWTVHVG